MVQIRPAKHLNVLRGQQTVYASVPYFYSTFFRAVLLCGSLLRPLVWGFQSGVLKPFWACGSLADGFSPKARLAHR